MSNVKDTLDKLRIITDYTTLWNQYFQYFSEDQESLRAGSDIEAAFLGMTQQLAYKIYELSERLPQEFEGAPAILKVLERNVSLKQLKSIPESEFDRMQVAWHEIFLALNKTRGKLEHALPPKVRDEMRTHGKPTSAAA